MIVTEVESRSALPSTSVSLARTSIETWPTQTTVTTSGTATGGSLTGLIVRVTVAVAQSGVTSQIR